ncbi:hypothetical protein [Kaistella jeonii]|uniref:Uncharacterized protein n=1 Tax=Kaistella jeonii TaxID=266749 RepID=A0A0C1D2S3_9FLAO|nr:hypothetical protein [Kaistella jeonii]KIA88080.1 hypothetical protein OA86_12850 [Kaistella jeonii]SFC31867.1 hypothetical protein SAMN05421876_11367 [Kaistella jeonii]VEI95626.1 Uncharacterised protein [Kaistella jeonii]
MKYFNLLFLVFPFLIFSQTTKPSLKLVVEKGTFLFDKESYKEKNAKLNDHLSELKKVDSLKKLNPKLNVTIIDDRILEYPKFDNATVLFKNKIFEILNIEKTKWGKNTFLLYR